MATKATIYKARLELADMDSSRYGTHDLTIARHPSETDTRMVVRLLAFALNAPDDNDSGQLELAKDMWAAEEPALWQKDLTGDLQQWIEVGQPDERRLMQASSRSKHVTVYAFGTSATPWWATIKNKITRARNISVSQIPPDQSEALARLVDRSMKLDVTVQDGTIWVGNGKDSVEVTLIKLR